MNHLRGEDGAISAGVGNIGGYTTCCAILSGIVFLATLSWTIFNQAPGNGGAIAATVVSGFFLLVLISCRVRWSVVDGNVIVSQLVFKRMFHGSAIRVVDIQEGMAWRQGVGYRFAPGESAMVCGSTDVVSLVLDSGKVFSFSADSGAGFRAAFRG